MVKSVRFDPQLERRLEQAAALEGVSVSALIRQAVAEHCDQVLGRDLSTDLAGIIGAVAVESPGGQARHTGPAFRQLLAARAARASTSAEQRTKVTD